MQKIKVTVCAGTTCHVMGGGHLYDLEEALPLEWRYRVDIQGVRCLGYCNEQDRHGKPPFVLINGQTIANASLKTVLERIKQEIDNPSPHEV
jgi:NADH:ubiquinone oxidoreductase 24 kD subunit